MAALDDIRFENDLHVHDFSMHSTHNLVAAGLVDGSVHVFEYGEKGHRSVLQSRHHNQSCRSVCFNHSGAGLLTASKDMSLGVIDIESGSLVSHQKSVHPSAINIIQVYDEKLFVSGDDDGTIAIWDSREWKKPAVLYKKKENDDFISDMFAVPNKDAMLVTSGDRTLSVWDVRAPNGVLTAMSDDMDDEILSVSLIKNGKKVVCGSQEGVLLVFSWGDFGDISDRFPGHPKSIDTMLVVDEDTICTGSSDGLIRIVQLQPNKLLGVIGDHDEMPVEKIELSHDKAFIASCSHDGSIKFWESGFLFEADEDEDELLPGGDDDSDVDMTDDVVKAGIESRPNFFDGF